MSKYVKHCVTFSINLKCSNYNPPTFFILIIWACDLIYIGSATSVTVAILYFLVIDPTVCHILCVCVK